MTEALDRLLERQRANGRTLLYRDAANGLDLDPPGVIGQLAEMLEQTMEQDAAAGKPFRAALIVGKPGIPRPGFFQKARSLGCYDGPDDGPEAQDWHAQQLEQLMAESGDHKPVR